MKRSVLGMLLLACTLITVPVWADTYNVDPDHTSVTFKIRHLLGYVNGTFNQFEGSITYDPAKPELSSTEGAIDAASIDTRVEQRDKHLQSKDFFDVETYPKITFKSTKILEATPEGGKLEGLLTIHGIEKPVVLDVEIHGVAKDPWGNERAAFTATTKINRKDFGLTWNQALETGKLLVGEEVRITIEAEGIKA